MFLFFLRSIFVFIIVNRLLMGGQYDVTKDISQQNFPVTDRYLGQFQYKYVTLKIIDNHGLPDYTCLYRVRVHGEPTRERKVVGK